MGRVIAVDEILFQDNPHSTLLNLLINLSNGLDKISLVSISNNKELPVKTINYLIEEEDVSWLDDKGKKHTVASHDIFEKTIGEIEKSVLREFLLQYKIAGMMPADYYVTNAEHLKTIIKRKKNYAGKAKVVTLEDVLRKIRAICNCGEAGLWGINLDGFAEQIKNQTPFYFSKNLNLIYKVDGHNYKEVPLEAGWGIRNILSFLLDTRDKIEILFQEKPSEYHAIIESVYYLNYFFVLMCSLFDNLAWFLVYYYKIPYKNVLSIRLDGNKKNSVVFDFFATGKEYADISSFIKSYQGFFEVFLTLRHLVAHRPRIPSLLTNSNHDRLVTYNIGTDKALCGFFNSRVSARYAISISQAGGNGVVSISPLKFIYASLDELRRFLDIFFCHVYNSEYFDEHPVIFKSDTNAVPHIFASLGAI